MSRIINIKELERAVNELWMVQGKYYVEVAREDEEGIVFLIYENATEELLLDLLVPYSDDISLIVVALKQEVKDTYITNFTNRTRPRKNLRNMRFESSNVLDFELYIREAKFYCEWIEIFEVIEECRRQHAS